jgi:hypothetical protein
MLIDFSGYLSAAGAEYQSGLAQTLPLEALAPRFVADLNAVLAQPAHEAWPTAATLTSCVNRRHVHIERRIGYRAIRGSLPSPLAISRTRHPNWRHISVTLRQIASRLWGMNCRCKFDGQILKLVPRSMAPTLCRLGRSASPHLSPRGWHPFPGSSLYGPTPVCRITDLLL